MLGFGNNVWNFRDQWLEVFCNNLGSLVDTYSDLCYDGSKFQQYRVDVVNVLKFVSFGENVELSSLI